MVRKGTEPLEEKEEQQNVSVTRPQKLGSGNLYVAYIDGARDRGRLLCPTLERRTEERTTVEIRHQMIGQAPG